MSRCPVFAGQSSTVQVCHKPSSWLVPIFIFAEGESRTPTILRSLAPEASASTNFATSAYGKIEKIDRWFNGSCLEPSCSFNKFVCIKVQGTCLDGKAGSPEPTQDIKWQKNKKFRDLIIP